MNEWLDTAIAKLRSLATTGWHWLRQRPRQQLVVLWCCLAVFVASAFLFRGFNFITMPLVGLTFAAFWAADQLRPHFHAQEMTLARGVKNWVRFRRPSSARKKGRHAPPMTLFPPSQLHRTGDGPRDFGTSPAPPH
ncbi:MAG: hypothetical protein CL878_07975 [Dehalococcoidia bacterium]|jgi:hypothetical protein|nr:hypothetical protein [Dehalococcoidia bacterium]